MIKILSICFISIFFSTSQAFAITPSPSPAMIEQLKKLPKSEQQRLMKQYGLSPSMLKSMTQGTSETESNDLSPLPRNTSPDKSDLSSEWPKQEQPYSETKLKSFGYDLFAGEPVTFSPVNDIPVAENYIVGPNDEVLINLYGRESGQYKIQVDRNGQLDIPELGPFNVTGLSFEELKQRVTDIVSSKYTGVSVSVGLGELRSIRVFVAGDAYKPGSYTVSSLSTITQALFVAGGINDIGSLRNIQLKRQGKLVSSFDLYDLLINGDASGDKRLRSGDVVFIPPVGATVSIKGQVRRPAIYELKNNETIAQLLKIAAGLKPQAFPAASILQRYDSSHLPSFINVDLTTKKAKNKRLKNGDTLIVQSTTKRIFKQVALLGAVTRPGLYQWHEGIKIADILKSSWSDLKDSADIDYALIIREKNLRGDIEVIQFNLGHAMASANSKDNVTLAPRDMLMVFSNNANQMERIELDRLVAQKIAPFSNKEYLELPTANTPDLFTAGFSWLTRDKNEYVRKPTNISQEQFKLNQQELELTSNVVSEVLLTLFNAKEKLEISSVLTRQELLYPVLEKLRQQANNNNPVAVTSISGEVRFPGVYPLSRKGSVLSLIRAGGGLKESAYIKQAELSRNQLDANYSATTQHLAIKLPGLSEHSPHYLNSKDHLRILTVPDWQKNISVELLGEVRFPGVYNIKNGESMMSVVHRAGGFTNNAFIEGAVFTRETVRLAEKKQAISIANQLRREIATRGLSQEGNFVSFDDASKMLTELENIESVGRMVIDLNGLEQHYNSRKDNDALRLEHGDKLIVPRVIQTVTVVGEVQHASSHFYHDHLALDEYIVLAGGSKQRADDDRIYIIKANGSVILPDASHWFSSQTQIEPGDTIVVPLDTEYKDTLSLWTQVTGIIYNSAVAFSAIKGI